MDLLFDKGFVIQNGSFAVATTDRDILLSRLRQYVYIRQGERPLNPSYGLVTQPQTATRSAALAAERERLNLSTYLPNVNVTAKKTEARTLELSFEATETALRVQV